MKVYQINCSSYGSTGSIAISIHNSLLKKGDGAFFAYGLGPKLVEESIRISNGFDIRVHSHFSYYTGNIGGYSKLCTKRLLLSIAKEHPDIIHLHNLHGNYVNLSLLLSSIAKMNIPIVLTLHDCWAFTGKCPHFINANCYKWKNEGCHDCRLLGEYPLIRKDKTNNLFSEKRELWEKMGTFHVVCVSNWLTATTKESFLKSNDIRTIYNGIDTAIFRIKNIQKTNFGIASNKKLLLGIANVWSERKGLNHWVQLREVLNDDYLIVLIGLSKSQVASLPEGIIGISRTENVEQLVDFYNAADIYINMSKEESFGLTTVEAMACGTPVIVTNSTANPELVDKTTGLVLISDSIYHLKNSIELIIETGKSNYSQSCRQRAVSLFSKDIMTNNYINLYHEIL